ncbi:MAG: hypothetical protein HOD92_02620 [Deltaproteobacteria bacterium]|jgi:hypothetical protein|nr:hypothetical protein [Deltaproteobacteria bacterium]MBT4527363.1 hypothetical protein [Deltaproteobacteria bacterium]
MKLLRSKINIANYPNLSTVFSKYQDMPLKEFSSRLFDKKPVEIESELLNALKKEWQALGWCSNDILKASQQLMEVPVIQTAHHVTPTNGPTFLTLDLMSLCGLNSNLYYLVGANSGVAFSNSAWTGSLSYENLRLQDLLEKNSATYQQVIKSNRERESHGNTEHRYSLIPARQRDQLSYGVEISEGIFNKYSNLNLKLRKQLPQMERRKLYNRWALKSCEKIQKFVFNQENILYFDINQVITNYLIQILEKEDSTHPVFQVFFGDKTDSIWKVFNEFPAFLGTYSGKKSYKVEQLYWKKSGLVGKKTNYSDLNPECLLKLLKQTKICPAVFITFFILKYVNGISCLGSFNQIEYLENIRQKLLDYSPNWQLHLVAETDNMLTTGRVFNDGEPYWPLDMFLKKRTINPQDFSNDPMIKFWQPIIRQLN